MTLCVLGNPDIQSVRAADAHTTDMSKRKRVNGYNVEVNVDVELDEELQEEEKDTYADSEEGPTREPQGPHAGDDISDYLHQKFASEDPVGTV